MSHTRFARRRPAAAAGLILVLGLLAACQSDPDTPQTDPGALAGLGDAGLGDAGSAGASDPAAADIGAGALDPYQAAQAELVRVGDRVLFATDRHDIAPDSEQVLRGQAALLQANPALTVTIAGHADERGTREYNLALADRRAAAVRNYLAALGVAEARMETVSYGKERPECAEAAESCWSRNRRGVTIINP